jgi:protein-S-isoprenylcysteine O-methyltransferase Ste14
MDTNGSRAFAALRGAIYASAFVLLWGWLASWVRKYDPRIPFSISSSLRIPGLILAAAGALLVLACVAAFAMRGRGTPAPFDAPRVFVATGPYRYVRNPMYVGGFAVLAGAGLALASPAILILAVGALILAHIFVILYEEPTLTERFGESYTDYKATVRRWIITRQKS